MPPHAVQRQNLIAHEKVATHNTDLVRREARVDAGAALVAAVAVADDADLEHARGRDHGTAAVTLARVPAGPFCAHLRVDDLLLRERGLARGVVDHAQDCVVQLRGLALLCVRLVQETPAHHVHLGRSLLVEGRVRDRRVEVEQHGLLGGFPLQPEQANVVGARHVVPARVAHSLAGECVGVQSKI